jgi:hypothetical protein
MVVLLPRESSTLVAGKSTPNYRFRTTLKWKMCKAGRARMPRRTNENGIRDFYFLAASASRISGMSLLAL